MEGETFDKREMASGIIGDLIYTVVYDFAGKIIDAKLAEEDVVNKVAQEMLDQMLSESVKLRKRPVSKKKSTITPAAKAKTGVVSAALRKGSKELTWGPLGKTGFLMCQDVAFSKGKLVANTEKEVMGFFDKKFVLATPEDLGELSGKGFKNISKDVLAEWFKEE